MSGTDRTRRGDETLEAHAARLTQRWMSRWQNILAASPDPREQAIALALTNAAPGGHAFNPDELVPGNEPSGDTPVNNNLVLLASQRGDPAVYSLAMSQCRNPGTDEMGSGSCQALSWEHWASIDPDNGLPWLWIAAKAKRAGDEQGVDDALGKAAAASHIESYGSALSALALDALPGNTSPLEEDIAGADLISILPVGVPLEILSLCSVTTNQPLRKQQCSAIAATLATHGSTFIDLAVAAGLANRLGFPEATRAALIAERRNARAGLDMSHPWGNADDVSRFRCANVAAFDGYIDSLQAARGNERAALTSFATTGRSAHTPR